MKKLLLLSAVLFSFRGNAQTEGDAFFAMPVVHDISMTFADPNYWDSLTAYMPLEQYMKANISIDGVAYNDVGIKFKGNSSYSNPSTKKPFKIDMNEFVSGQDIDGLKKFNLNNGFKDPSFMREKIALDFYNEHQLAAPRCAYTKVTINGTYWGLYMFVEEANKTFLDDDDRFGNKQGNLFKGDPSGDLKWLGSTASNYYTKYELHTNETANDWSDLVHLIDEINNSGSFFYDSLEAVLQTDHFIRHWAAMNLFSNLDSYIGSGHNYFLYHDTLSGKFEFISWDVNESFGNFTMGMTPTQMKNLSMYFISTPATNRPLVQKMLADPTYKQILTDVFCVWLQYDFSNAALDAKVDSLAAEIRPHVYADTKKFYTNTDFDNNLSSDVTVPGGPGGGGTIIGIKSFITERRNALLAELFSNGCALGINDLPESGAGLYPNPARNEVTLLLPAGSDDNRVVLYNAMGQEVLSRSGVSDKTIINISGLPEGVYILSLNNSSRLRLVKAQ